MLRNPGQPATLSNPGRALTADGLTAAGGLLLRRAKVTGEVALSGAHVGGVLNCEGATLSNPGGPTLSADGLTVDGALFLRSVKVDDEVWLAKVTGEVSLAGAHVRGPLDCDGAMLSNPGGRALSGDGLTVDGALFLRGAKVTGEVALPDAHVGQLTTCEAATLSNPCGPALTADGLTVDGALLLRRAEVTGEVGLSGAHVGQLDCDDATLSNTGGSALTADGLTVDSHLLLRRAKVTGEMALPSAHVGQFESDGATLSNTGSRALNLERALVTNAALMRPALLDGSIDLTAARVGACYDNWHTWPTALKLEGFVYDAIDPAGTPKQRLAWLRLNQDGYLPQPAIDYFEASGLPYVIGVNGFHRQFPHPLNDVRHALDVSPNVPVIQCDARDRRSAETSLVTLIEHAISLAEQHARPDEP